jgi:hypothetical protein
VCASTVQCSAVQDRTGEFRAAIVQVCAAIYCVADAAATQQVPQLCYKVGTALASVHSELPCHSVVTAC